MVETVGEVIIIQTKKLLTNLDELTEHHEMLISISKSKTEQIKSGDMDNLSKLLMQERKQLQAIVQSETKRQELVNQVFNEIGIGQKDKTVSELMNHITNKEEQKQLDEAVTKLANSIIELKQTEQLNNELIQQSMQFVQLSLDMLQPSAQSINYTNKTVKQERIKQSVFDSKA